MQDQSSSIPPIGVAFVQPPHPSKPVISHEEISILALAAVPAAVRWARRHSADVLSRWGVAELEWGVCQAASELVTNAVNAAGPVDPDPKSPGPIRFTLRLYPRDLLLEVFDSFPGTPEARTTSTEDETGRGLSIVTAIADGFGTYEEEGGKTAWARFGRTVP